MIEGTLVRRAHPALVADMANNPDDILKWFIAVGDNNGWGRSDKSEKAAIASMNRNGRGKAVEFSVYKCTAETTIDGYGNLMRPAHHPEPVKITARRKAA